MGVGGTFHTFEERGIHKPHTDSLKTTQVRKVIGSLLGREQRTAFIWFVIVQIHGIGRIKWIEPWKLGTEDTNATRRLPNQPQLLKSMTVVVPTFECFRNTMDRCSRK